MRVDRSHPPISNAVPAIYKITPVHGDEKATCPGTNKQYVFISLMSIKAFTFIFCIHIKGKKATKRISVLCYFSLATQALV